MKDYAKQKMRKEQKADNKVSLLWKGFCTKIK